VGRSSEAIANLIVVRPQKSTRHFRSMAAKNGRNFF
jgi:hypothetical protein